MDRDIEHDDHGFPFLRGKTLKGLLAESAENVTFALENEDETLPWHLTKNALFGTGGLDPKERGILHIEDAQLPTLARRKCLIGWKKEDVLYSLTGIRRQTSINEHGAPDHATLRSMRVLLPGVTLEAKISFDRGSSADGTSTAERGDVVHPPSRWNGAQLRAGMAQSRIG